MSYFFFKIPVKWKYIIIQDVRSIIQILVLNNLKIRFSYLKFRSARYSFQKIVLKIFTHEIVSLGIVLYFTNSPHIRKFCVKNITVLWRKKIRIYICSTCRITNVYGWLLTRSNFILICENIAAWNENMYRKIHKNQIKNTSMFLWDK